MMNINNLFVDNKVEQKYSIFFIREENMDNRHIKCNVNSCEYNNCSSHNCSLNQIEVKACSNGNTGKATDESMCGSYKCKCNQ